MTDNNLQKKVAELEAQVRKLKKNNLGLVFEDKAEDVVEQSKTKVPVLKELIKNRLDLDEAYPNNLMIEGDNYFALSVLNYTHKKNIDLIYIDPPYNTGSHDFIYNDKYVDLEDGFRHSKWLSFMYNRLRLAKDLLKDDGLIFISIDDNEQAHLRVLCDKIFGEENFVFQFVIDKTAQGANQSATFKQTHEYCLLYTKGTQGNINSDTDTETDNKKYKFRDERGLYAITNSFDSINSPLSANKNRGYTVYYNQETGDAQIRDEYERGKGIFGNFDQGLVKKGYTPIRPGTRKGIQYPWNWVSTRFLSDYKKDLVFMKNRKGELGIYHKNRATGKTKDTTLKRFDTRNFGNQILVDILGEKKFDYPKSLDMMKWVISKHNNTSANVLDFFAGSGTTGHAVLEMNKIDGGNRKFILCTNNENNNGGNGGIAESVCYPRIKAVIKGYKNKKSEKVSGLPSNLFYYQTDLVDIEQIHKVPDDAKIRITYEAGEMIAVREDALNEVEKNEWWQIFKGKGELVAIYFKEDKAKLAELIAKLEKKNLPTALYIFSWGKNEYKGEYSSANIRVEDIPEPIIEVYKELNRI